MEENIDIKNFINIKYFEEELKDVYNFIEDFINNHTEKEISSYYESVIIHKVDRLCFGIPNFILSVGVFQMVKEIFKKIIQLKENKSKKSEKQNRINEMYLKFKYLMEWCIFYYEETYLSN